MKECTIDEADRAMKEGCRVIDVRPFPVFNAGHIEKATHVEFDRVAESAGLNHLAPLLVFCQRGISSLEAAGRLDEAGFQDVRSVTGGMEAWIASGRPVVRGPSRVWPMERQVRLAAGSLTLGGAALGWLAHPYFFALPAFIGGGLVFSALTDTCGMARCLARLPWNKRC